LELIISITALAVSLWAVVTTNRTANESNRLSTEALTRSTTPWLRVSDFSNFNPINGELHCALTSYSDYPALKVKVELTPDGGGITPSFYDQDEVMPHDSVKLTFFCGSIQAAAIAKQIASTYAAVPFA